MSAIMANGDRYKALRKIVVANWDSTLIFADAVRQIKEDKLYLVEFDTWDAFCHGLLKFTPQHVNRLIEAWVVEDSIKNANEVAKQSEPVGSLLLDAPKLENEHQARALSAVPASVRSEVLKTASQNGPLSARTITEAALRVVAPEVRKDEIGRVIPEEVVPDWDRARQVAADLRSNISEVKVTVERGLASRDIIFAEITNPTISEANSLYYTLSQIIPHSVCPQCQGRNRARCQLCRGRGWISKYLFNSPGVSEKTKAILEKAARK